MPDDDWLQPEARQALINFLDGWLEYRASERLFPGFSVAIAVRGRPVYARGFGMADMIEQTAFSARHAVCVGSQSKMMTAMLVLKLAHEGALRLHDEIGRYLPWLAEHRDPRTQHITVEQLLHHRSGLPRDGATADFWLQTLPFPDASALQQLVLESNLVYPNGTRTKYSNLGYALLGQVIEAASGRPYGELAEQWIIRPPGLADTWVETGTPGIPQRPTATGYTRHIDGRRQQLPSRIPTASYAAATGWYSTPGDMAKILWLFTDPAAGFLPQPQLESFWRGQHGHWQPALPERGVYGYGALTTTADDRPLMGHSGGFIAYCSCSYVDVERGICVSVCGNAAGVPVNEMAMGLFGVVGHFIRNAEQPTPPELQNLNGVYQNTVGVRAIVAVGRSVVSVPLDDWSPFDMADVLEPQTAGTLRLADGNFLAAPGELVTYDPSTIGSLQAVTYAGMTLTRWQTRRQ